MAKYGGDHGWGKLRFKCEGLVFAIETMMNNVWKNNATSFMTAENVARAAPSSSWNVPVQELAAAAVSAVAVPLRPTAKSSAWRPTFGAEAIGIAFRGPLTGCLPARGSP